MIINTRPSEVAGQFVRAWSGLQVVASPLHAYAEVSYDPSVFEGADALVFTSQCALINLPQSLARSMPVYAVGSATAAAARAAGFVDVTTAAGTAAELLPLLQNADFQHGVYVSARHVSRDLQADLPDRLIRVVGYEMTPADRLSQAALDILHDPQRVVVPFYSPRAFAQFEQLLEHHGLTHTAAHLSVAAIHPRVLKGQRLTYRREVSAPEASGVSLSQLTAHLYKELYCA